MYGKFENVIPGNNYCVHNKKYNQDFVPVFKAENQKQGQVTQHKCHRQQGRPGFQAFSKVSFQQFNDGSLCAAARTINAKNTLKKAGCCVMFEPVDDV